MEITWELWWLLPAATAIATIAMATGVGGAVFFSPLFILVLGLDPKVAIGTALMTELFGFSSGVFAYFRKKLIDFKLGFKILIISVPASIIGLFLGKYIPADVLKGVFAAGIIVIAYQIFSAWRKEEHEQQEGRRKAEFEHTYETDHVDANGKHYRYTVCNPGSGKFFAGVGGLFVGMISVGLGELLDFHLVSKCKVPTPVAVGTAIFTVVITVLVASMGHFYEFLFHSEPSVLKQVASIVIFTIPGVLIGGQIGPRLQQIIPEDFIKVGLSILFVAVGILMFYTLV